MPDGLIDFAVLYPYDFGSQLADLSAHPSKTPVTLPFIDIPELQLRRSCYVAGSEESLLIWQVLPGYPSRHIWSGENPGRLMRPMAQRIKSFGVAQRTPGYILVGLWSLMRAYLRS